MSLIKKRYYFYDFFKTEENIPHFYRLIINTSSKRVLHDCFANNKLKKHTIRKVNHIPDYLSVDYNYKNDLRIKSINRDIGYAINLDNEIDVDTYVNRQFKKGRKIIKCIEKLENAFNITYKRYYGDISENVYSELLECLFKMVQKRFNLLDRVNKQINANIWQRTLDDTFSLIKNKKASLFVTYDDDKPIIITIAHHWGNVFYGVMCSFDIDYSKFGLGHVNLYKQVEWCIDNGYKTFDVGPGEYDYKKRWSNKTYNLLQHVIYKKSNLKSLVLANVEIAFTLLKKYLKCLSVKPYLKLIKRRFSKKNNKIQEYSISYIDPEDLNLYNYDKICYYDNTYSFLRKIVFDFLYTKSEHKKDVKVFKNTVDTRFIIKGEKAILLYDIL